MRWLALLALVCVTGSVVAQPQSRIERLDEALRAMLISLAQDPLFSQQEDFDLSYRKQPEAVVNLGAICDTRGAGADREGLPVIAVTPGSTGASMGLRAGDRLLEINGQSLVGLGVDSDGEALAMVRMQQVLLEATAGDPVTLEVNRDGSALKLTAPLQKWQLPKVELALSMPSAAADSRTEGDPDTPCGTISLYEPPPDDFDLYPAYLTGINEKNSGAVMRHFQYLHPGPYELLVTDLIPSRELRQRHTRFSHRRSAKSLRIDVADGMVYHVAAKLLYDRKEQAEHEEYWEPVVWRLEPGFCKGRPVAR